MGPRRVKVFRGWVSLGATAEEALSGEPPSRFEADRWLEQRFEATTGPAGARFVAVRHGTQTASGGSYLSMLGAGYFPTEAPSLTLRVAVAPAGSPGLTEIEAPLVLVSLGEAIEAWPSAPSGEVRVEHALVHEVDNKAWAWRASATLLGALLAPGVDALTDAEIATLAQPILTRER